MKRLLVIVLLIFGALWLLSSIAEGEAIEDEGWSDPDEGNVDDFPAEDMAVDNLAIELD